MKGLKKHLNEVDESYFEHMAHAIRFSAQLFVAAIACFIHAVFPFLCIKTGSKKISQLHHDMVTHRLKTQRQSEEAAVSAQNGQVTASANQ